MELDPRNGATVNRLANLLTEQGRYAEAEGLFRQAYEILGSSGPLTNRARLYFLWKADHELVRRTLDEAPVAMRSDRYWSVRGYILQMIGDLTGALAAFSIPS